MAIIDSRLEFADAVALDTSGTDTDNVGDVIDLGAQRDIGQGQAMYLHIQVSTALTSGGSATVQFSLASDGSDTIATDGNQTVHLLTDAIAVATLVQGFSMSIPIPAGATQQGKGNIGYERYLGFQTVTGTAALTAGAVNAYLSLDPQGWRSYPDANN